MRERINVVLPLNIVFSNLTYGTRSFFNAPRCNHAPRGIDDRLLFAAHFLEFSEDAVGKFGTDVGTLLVNDRLQLGPHLGQFGRRQFADFHLRLQLVECHFLRSA